MGKYGDYSLRTQDVVEHGARRKAEIMASGERMLARMAEKTPPVKSLTSSRAKQLTLLISAFHPSHNPASWVASLKFLIRVSQHLHKNDNGKRSASQHPLRKVLGVSWDGRKGKTQGICSVAPAFPHLPVLM